MTIQSTPRASSHPVRAALIALAIMAGAAVVLYIVAFEQGALTGTGMLMHELMHDGRHLMGVPCH
ncbi:CbtB-domain containing protein [Hoyosella sp. G463]|uniref:CbtB-domain containing protein n=1 Tax=Lolliginicoccus lacisalsi TaxID=2742202 RepID=A0A927PLC7_9ACTN|nr:CbtB domain-containing protein [Lolliginicoccus lacisalsi]MBD8506975.1 CbtB-domain containing protein [Lolliginicoccus lacisalsi]